MNEMTKNDEIRTRRGKHLAAIADPVNQVRALALLEGVTLIGLVLIAVPLKYLWGQPQVVSLLGPVHGICFTAYAVMSINLGIGRAWPWLDITRMLAAAMIPFGTPLNDAWLRNRTNERA